MGIKFLSTFEGFAFGTKFLYKKGDYVKYIFSKSYLFIVDGVDDDDYYKPYLIKIIHDDPDALIVGNNYWVKESELYMDSETEKLNTQNKFNL